MLYLLLIYSDEQAWERLPEEKREAILKEYAALTGDMRRQGRWIAGAPLHPTSTATTVRVRDDELVVTDGPFAETKEQLGGFFLIDAPSSDEARAWATKVPAARYGAVEVRPVVPVEAEVAAS
jgi:hypothetical protein